MPVGLRVRVGRGLMVIELVWLSLGALTRYHLSCLYDVWGFGRSCSALWILLGLERRAWFGSHYFLGLVRLPGFLGTGWLAFYRRGCSARLNALYIPVAWQQLFFGYKITVLFSVLVS